jgi:hypothetical protein
MRQRKSHPPFVVKIKAATAGECEICHGREGTVKIHLQTRRFRCPNKECARKIIAESLPVVAARQARETMRLCEIVGLVGYALGGLPGERLLNRLGIKSGDDTVLRRVKGRRRGSIQPAVRVLTNRNSL